jgi:hypothetical protein
MQLSQTSRNSEEFLGSCNSENFHDHMSSLWFPARSVSTAAVHAQRGPLNRLAVPWWKWPSCRPRVMRLPAVGIIEVWNRLGKWNIISLVILTTWLNLWCDLNSLETLPSATNCSIPFWGNHHIGQYLKQSD